MNASPSGDEWVIDFEATSRTRRAIESLTALSDGDVATRCLTPRPNPTVPTTLAAGVYDDADVPALLVGPAWTAMNVAAHGQDVERVRLDMWRGVLCTEVGDAASPVRAVRFASIVRPGIHVLRVTGAPDVVDSGAPDVEHVGDIAVAIEDLVEDVDGVRCITRIAAFSTVAERSVVEPERRLDDAVRVGFSALLDEHVAAWRIRWSKCAVDLPAQPSLQRAIRFGLFHLLMAAPQRSDAGIGARALTGPAYKGHVFWDTEMFVLPALSALAPDDAEGALRYRWRRRDAARRRAANEGRSGTRFPWESAATGEEVTPAVGRDLHGGTVPILTGQMEEHIVSDVAWAASNHHTWTDGAGPEPPLVIDLLVETARYWQSRVQLDADGSAHIRGVIGPDEYHENVDDNAYTNVMARWNLEAAADAVDRIGSDDRADPRRWRETARHIVDGYDGARGVHEQFSGFFELDDMVAGSLGRTPLAADALLGRDRVGRTQILKQPDVVMLHHVVPDRLPAGTLERDLDFYLPRTAHGSSLSPAITASVLARVGRTVEGRHWFDIAARFDLDDLSGTSAGGVHLATMGGLWQALTFGFFGVRAAPAGLRLDPRIPPDWGTATVRFCFRSSPVTVEASVDRVVVRARDPVSVIDGTGTSTTGCCIVGRLDHDEWRYS